MAKPYFTRKAHFTNLRSGFITAKAVFLAGRVVCVRFANYCIDQCLHWSKRLLTEKPRFDLSTLHRLSSTKKHHPFGWCFLVEAGRVELPSESSLTGTSPGAVCYLHSLIRPGADTLPDSVASLCVVRAKLTARTFSTQMTPEPDSWTFRGGWAGLIRQPEQTDSCQLI